MLNIILLLLVLGYMVSILATTFWEKHAVLFYVVGIVLSIGLILITTGYFGG